MKNKDVTVAALLGALGGLLIWLPAYVLPRTSFNTLAESNPAEWWTAGAAVFALVVSGIQAGFFWWQLGMMRTELNASHRPRLIVRGIEFRHRKIFKQFPDTETMKDQREVTFTNENEIHYHVVNVGNGKAILKKVVTTKFLNSEPRIYRKTIRNLRLKGIDGSSSSTLGEYMSGPLYKSDFRKRSKREIPSGGRAIFKSQSRNFGTHIFTNGEREPRYFQGFIEYVDEIGIHRATAFCCEIPVGGGFRRTVDDPEHNYAD